MSHFADDIHRKLSARLNEVIPDFVTSEYPKFVSFLKAYYEFLEQVDDLPTQSTYVAQPGVVSVQVSNSVVVGSGTQFDDSARYAPNVLVQVGSDQFRIRSVANNTHLTIYEVPVRAYFANTHTVETNRSVRQAAGAARQILTIHDVDETLDDFIVYFRDTYLRDIPQGLTDTRVLLPRILDFYQARGSEASYEFLFRSLYGQEVSFAYPRDSVFTTSDNEYVEPTIVRLDYDEDTDIAGDVSLLETREIVGLTSRARATVFQTVIAYEGQRRVVRAFISDPIIEREAGDLLLEDGTGRLLVSQFGVPPEGLESQVYTYTLLQEFVERQNFQVGETISTLPVEDPLAIRGRLLGSVLGFTVNSSSRGSNYQLGELVYPPALYANASTATGGFGAVGRISAFTDVDIDEFVINDSGIGYYKGLPLIVDNSGTGGSGLSGFVSAVSPGRLLLLADAAYDNLRMETDENVTTEDKQPLVCDGPVDDPDPALPIAEGDTLVFTHETSPGVVESFRASLEKIDYYEVGISLATVLTDPIEINAPAWSTNSLSAIYNVNLNTPIVNILSNVSVFPFYINGVRTELGEIAAITPLSLGSGYVAGLPVVAVQPPQVPTKDEAGQIPLTYREIFGEDFRQANISVVKEVGQIGQVEVITGGSGYENRPFFVDQTTSTTKTGSGAELGLVLGALSYGEPYFRNTRSFASSDQYLQDITKYQPFAYEMTVEEDLYRYADVVRRLVHPAGGLLLPRQTITTEIALESLVEDISVS